MLRKTLGTLLKNFGYDVVKPAVRLTLGGVIIIDDYGHREDAGKTVDEYIKAEKLPLLLNRIDYTGRIGIKY